VNDINGERVKQAREFCEFSQTELANRIGITQPAIAEIESDRFKPSEEVIIKIAFQTGFPVSFFKQKQDIDIPLGSLLFRSSQKATVREINCLHRNAQIIYTCLLDFLYKNVKDIPVRIPIINNETPSEAAKITRSALGLSPDKPIGNLFQILEQAGVAIIILPMSSSTVKAFSFWVGSYDPRPVIAFTVGWPTDRLRLSASHELGHLVLHSFARGNRKTLEEEAYQFAGEFLMPEEQIRKELTLPIKLSDLADLKLRWGVAMSALIVRADRLGIINKDQYRYLSKQLSKRGWKTHEPNNLEPQEEKPRLLTQLAERSYGVPINIAKLASDSHLSTQLVERVLNNFLVKEKSVEKVFLETNIFPIDSKKRLKKSSNDIDNA
jgi:Zn-dependent peptidase ImmA (M78 family)/transcriptional regulator with XRE-family HTH domain